ncbi:DUF1134 domain-containing protein [Novosphingobium sp. M1R2S20]|uniref:DUF1134 domain-containing protein n=1 Tax=Novosphingobium rhizovicinum TaxID=3228928 RepID=A0ABV3RCI4_9SPHN
MKILKFRPSVARAMAFLGIISMSIASPAMAQVRAVDPDAAIDGDLSGQAAPSTTSSGELPSSSSSGSGGYYGNTGGYGSNGTPVDSTPAPPASSVDDWNPQSIATEAATPPSQTYRKDDLIGAAEGVFGKGAQGLAGLIEDLLSKQGEPNAYIVGREGSGAFVVGLRYGSGTLHHKVEGTRPVYWTGPSVGFDAGLNAANAFVLVYNLYDTEELYKRFPAGEGQAYFVGGFHVSYLRRGDVVLIPVRMGAGVRLGINAGYMKFSHEQNWLPF